MSDPHEEPNWEFTPSEFVDDIIALSGSSQQQQQQQADIITLISGSGQQQQQEQQEQQEQEADVITLSGSGYQAHSLNSSDLSLADYFPDIFFQTLPPDVTTDNVGLSVREPEQPTPACALECGQSNKGKRKADAIETPQPLLDTSQSEDIIEERAREQLEETGRQTRLQSTEVRNINERRRRGRINERIQVLGNLIPTCKKTEIASILDEAIVYIRALKVQVEVYTKDLNICPLQQQQEVFPYFRPYLPLQMTPWLGHHPMFALPSSAFHFPPDAPSYRPISRLSSFPISRPQIIPLISPSSSAGAARINFSASVSEQIFAVNQPRFGESSSQNIQRLPTSSYSFPVIRQGSFPFSTSYTVHATHTIPPTNTKFQQFDDAADCTKSGV